MAAFPLGPIFFLIVPPLTVYILFFHPFRTGGLPLLPLFQLVRPRRQTLVLRFFLGAVSLATWFWLVSSSLAPHEPWQIALHLQQRPPDYKAWRDAEKALPQNNPDLPPPQGRKGRYVRFSNHLRLAGWGHAMQEMLINAQLAVESNRIFVLYNYDKDDTPGEYDIFSWGLAHTRVPITAMLGGPIAGGPFPASHPHPPAVTTDFFRKICPDPTRVNITNLKTSLSIDGPGVSAQTTMTRLSEYLANLEDNCVEVMAGSGQIFDEQLFADPSRMMGIYPLLLHSPLLQAWQWSPLVASAARANRQLIHPKLSLPSAPLSPLKGLLALHIRRGDFANRCESAAKGRMPFHGFNAWATFPDDFALPSGGPSAGGGEGESQGEERETAIAAYYETHCFPSLMDIVRRVSQIRRDAATQGQGHALNRIYILTNASRGWLAGLKYALHRAGLWDAITTSRDLELNREQTFVVQGVDMLLAARAEVFVGNAWSTVTANINLVRVAHDFEPETTRFW